MFSLPKKKKQTKPDLGGINTLTLNHKDLGGINRLTLNHKDTRNSNIRTQQVPIIRKGWLGHIIKIRLNSLILFNSLTINLTFYANYMSMSF